MLQDTHYVATGYVYDQADDRFLFILHKKLGKWLPPGGHLHNGEEPHQGALREILEETGLTGQIIDLLQTPNVQTHKVPQLPTPFCILSEIIPATSSETEHTHIDFVYVVQVNSSQTLHVNTTEVTTATWFFSRHINTIDTFQNVRKVCQAISAIGQKHKDL